MRDGLRGQVWAQISHPVPLWRLSGECCPKPKDAADFQGLGEAGSGPRLRKTFRKLGAVFWLDPQRFSHDAELIKKGKLPYFITITIPRVGGIHYSCRPLEAELIFH